MPLKSGLSLLSLAPPQPPTPSTVLPLNVPSLLLLHFHLFGILWFSRWSCVYIFVRLFVRPSVCRTSVRSYFAFPDDNLSKYQLIFTHLGMCIVEILFWIDNWQIMSIFDSYLPVTR